MSVQTTEFDSEIFGLRIGWSNSWDGDACGHDLVFVRETFPCAIHPRVDLIDVRLEMVGRASDRTEDHSLASVDEKRSVEPLAAEAFSEHSRYFRDPRLASRAPDVYRQWLRNCRETFVVDGGFLAMSRTERCMRIDLLAVDPSARGRGIGRQLVQTFLYTAGPPERRVKVEAGNARAINLYSSAGFRIERAESVQHVWSQ